MMAAACDVSDLSSALFELLEAGILCDTELLTDTKSLWAHSIVLAAVSKPLRHAFVAASAMSTRCRYQIQLTGCDPVVVESILQFLYTGKLYPLKMVNTGLVHAENIYAVCKILGISAEKLQQVLSAADGL